MRKLFTFTLGLIAGSYLIYMNKETVSKYIPEDIKEAAESKYNEKVKPYYERGLEFYSTKKKDVEEFAKDASEKINHAVAQYGPEATKKIEEATKALNKTLKEVVQKAQKQESSNTTK